MADSGITSVAIIGAGRLAVNFANSLRKKGIPVIQIYNRTKERGLKLASKVSCPYIDNLDELTDQADLYALAVSDQVLEETASKMRPTCKPIIHFSGTAPLQLLKGKSSQTGVFYAPQSFTYGSKAGFLGVPICIEASNRETEDLLAAFAGIFSGKIYRITESQRRTIHISAIFAGNFTNFMVAIAEDLLNRSGLPLELVRPVLEKTRQNAARGNVFERQTGPAARNDLLTIFEHLGILSDLPEYREIYRLMSECIIQFKQNYPNDKL